MTKQKTHGEMAASCKTNGVLGIGEWGSAHIGNSSGDAQLEAVFLEGEADVGGGEGGEALQTGLHVESGVDAADSSK